MRRFRSLIAGMLLAGLTVLVPQPALAATDCDALVEDITSDQVLDDTKIVATGANLERKYGADVRVRAFQSNPGMSLDAYHELMLEQCASWRGPDGLTKANLITYVFSIDDRDSFVAIGDNYTDEISHDELDGIRDDAMGDRFREGDFTAGIVDAMSATEQAIEPPPPAEPSNAGKYLLWFIGVVFALALLAAGAFGLIRLRQNRKHAEAKREETQQAAIDMRKQAADAMAGLSMDDVDRDVAIIVTNLNEEDSRHIKAMHRVATDSFGLAINADTDRQDSSAGLDPESRLKTLQYERLIDRDTKIVELAAKAAQDIKGLGIECDTLLHRIEKSPEDLARLQAGFSTLQEHQLRLEGAGYRIEKLNDIGLIGQLLVEAKQEVDNKRFGHAIDELGEADQMIKNVSIYFEELEVIRQQLEARHQELNRLLERAHDGAENDEVLEELRSSFNERCWYDVVQSHAELTGQLATAKQLLDQAEHDMSMDIQQWKSAGSSLDQAKTLIGDPDRYPDYVAARLEKLEVLQETLPGRVERIIDDALSAKEKVSTLKGSHQESERYFDDMAIQAKALLVELDKHHPDLVDLDRQAEEIDESVKLELKEAKAEHDRIKAEQKAAKEAERRRREREEDEARRASSHSSSFATGYAATSFTDSGSSSSNWSSGGGDSSSGGFSGGGGDSSSGGW